MRFVASPAISYLLSKRFLLLLDALLTKAWLIHQQKDQQDRSKKVGSYNYTNVTNNRSQSQPLLFSQMVVLPQPKSRFGFVNVMLVRRQDTKAHTSPIDLIPSLNVATLYEARVT
jgi:hypothetical protein